MPDYKVHLVPLTVVPVVVFLLITTLNIIGNVLKALSYSNTSLGIASVWISLWESYVCSTSGSCVLYNHRELDLLLGSSSNCESFISHFRAAEAFGIITSFFAGLLVLISIILIVHQESIGFREVSRRGLVLSAILFALDLITFILFITTKDRTCIASVATISLEPAPFMYLCGFVLALVNCGIYLRIGHVFKHYIPTVSSTSTTPAAPRFLPGSTPQQQRSMVAERSIQIQPSATIDRSVPRSIVEQRPVSPIRVRSPARVRSPVSSGDGLWPDGDDWQMDEPSGLLWSENKHLFFDRSSGQFFDPKSDQWYDPEADRWYKLTK